MAGAVVDGYATLTTDAGLGGAPDPIPWALLSPGNVNLYLLQNLASVSLEDGVSLGSPKRRGCLFSPSYRPSSENPSSSRTTAGAPLTRTGMDGMSNPSCLPYLSVVSGAGVVSKTAPYAPGTLLGTPTQTGSADILLDLAHRVVDKASCLRSVTPKSMTE